MTTDKSVLHQTALSIIDGYNKWDIEAILAPRASNCTQRVYPNRLDRPTLNNDQYREYFQNLMPLFKNFRATILDVTEDQANNKVALHVSSQAETAMGPYANEYVILLQMTEDQRQVVSVKEFVDSGYSEDFFARMRAHVAKG